VSDRWDDALDRAMPTRWVLDAAGTLGVRDAGWIGVGTRANRSSERVTVHGVSTHVPSGHAGAWSVADALAYLAASHRFEIDLSGLNPAVRDAPLVTRVSLSRTLGEQLAEVLEPYGMWVQREVEPSGDAPPSIRVVPLDQTARVRLEPAWDPGRPSSIVRTRIDVPARRSRRWVARGARPVVEDTFELLPGWDRALEVAPDSAFDRGQSSDFALYGNVFRRWVLNEDAAFEGPAFDLSAFFGQAVMPARLAFGACVTLDDAGQRRPPLIEFSLDEGATWSRFAEAVDVLGDRAGVRVEATSLSGPYLDAGRAGTLRVRVTASLTSPLPEEVARWRGNPFYSPAPDAVFDLAELYASRRVAAGSVHRAAIDAGELSAAMSEAPPRLAGWLNDRLERLEATGWRGGRAEVRLLGAWWTLRPGDRVFGGGGDGLNIEGGDEAIDGRGAVIERVRIVCDEGVDDGVWTDLTLQT
jgi:hypothetical protein